MPARALYQNASHQLGRDSEEMGAILPLHALVIHQAHVSFIDQSCRLQTVTGALAFQIAICQAVKFLIHDGCQASQGVCVAIAPGA